MIGWFLAQQMKCRELSITGQSYENSVYFNSSTDSHGTGI